MLRLAALLALLAAPALAERQSFTFQPTEDDVPNPERGWWIFAAEDFAQATEEELAYVASEGLTVAYGIVQLDTFRDRPLSQELLTNLERSFALARAQGLKIILRFAYNYPASSTEYETAEDAPLPVVLQHIAQLAPVIRANADTILVLQGGFIGAWGESHTSSNGLDAPGPKAAIRDALYAAVPEEVPLQWRYPGDILSWEGDRRMGFHNDCFLSSPTDVGTYSEDPALRAEERAAMAALTERHVFTGETCDADRTAVRLSCEAILAEGAEFHLTALNREYYEAFPAAWKAEGCLPTVTARMGYRLRLVDLTIEDGALSLRIANDGWARPVQARPILATAYREGQRLAAAATEITLDEIGAGDTATLTARLPGIAGADRLCISAPTEARVLLRTRAMRCASPMPMRPGKAGTPASPPSASSLTDQWTLTGT